MSIPDFQTVMLPLLEALADGQVHLMREVTGKLADRFDLTEDEKQQLQPSGEQTVFYNRVAWAKTHMKKAGLVENPSRGAIRISELGREVLARNLARIDIAFLRQFPPYARFQQRTWVVGEVNDEKPQLLRTPEEQLETAYR
jgi:restriction system protein